MAAIRWLHLVAMAVWVGGLITLGALVGALRRHGVEREILRLMARRFGVVSWTAMAVLVVTGLVQGFDRGWDRLLTVKATGVGAVVALAAWHQVAARNQSPAVRGLLQASILAVSLGVVSVSVVL